MVLASEEGWATLNNGKLLEAAESAGYKALVTIDKGIAHQQNLEGRFVSVVLLDTTDTRIAVLDLLVEELLATLENLEHGKLYVLSVAGTE